MSQPKQKTKRNQPKAVGDHLVYPTWEAFVKVKVDQTNELLSRMDQDALRQLINARK